MLYKIRKLLALSLLGQLPLISSMGQDPLLFPKEHFTIETKTVKTSTGEKKVTYRSYMHLLYVSKPIDKDYQSLNVSVPIRVGDKAVDASNAPILFVIAVGGYMSVNNARGAGFGPGMGGPPPGAGPMGNQPPGPPPGMAPMGNAPGSGNNKAISSKSDLALAAGYVVVTPGCRGRDNQAPDGTYYGKAPAAIVDLKAAVRYIRHNQGVLPGNTHWIFSTGVSAGGALSALLGASGNSPLYEPYLKEIGAAEAPDNVQGSACFCPITDLDHADAAYEWMYGSTPIKQSGLVDPEISNQLKKSFADYQASLQLQGKNGFGILSAENYGSYLVQYYLVPAANNYLKNLSDDQRSSYLGANKWIAWNGQGASFSFADYVSHVGRMKGLPAFDDFNLRQPETSEFGSPSMAARHFTNFSLQHTTGNQNAKIIDSLQQIVSLMNAMYFISQKNKGCAAYWWLRQGSSDAHTSQTVMANLATSLENQQKNVNTRLYWDAGHGADEDPEDFILWMGKITGFSANPS